MDQIALRILQSGLPLASSTCLRWDADTNSELVVKTGAPTVLVIS